MSKTVTATFLQHPQNIFLLVGMLILAPMTLQAAPSTIKITDNFDVRNVSEKIEYYNDQSGTLSFEQVRALPENAWVRVQRNAVSFGFTHSTYWLRLAVENTDHLKLLLQGKNPAFDELTLYADQNGAIQRLDAGMSVAPLKRPILHRHHLFPVPTGERIEIWIRARNSGSFYLPLVLWREDVFFDQDSNDVLVFGAYFGAMLVIILINLIAYVAARNNTFLCFIGFIFCFAAYQLTMLGIGANTLWGIENLYRTAMIYAIAGAIFSGSMLFSLGLDMKKNSPTGDVVLRVIAGLTLVAILGFGLAGFQATSAFLAALVLPAAITIMIVSIKMALEGHRFAVYALVGCTSMLVGTSLHSLTRLDLMQMPFAAEHSMFLGILIMMLTLSAAFAAEMRQRNLKQVADAATQKEGEAVRQIQINQELEDKVKSRTAELERALKELSDANENLQELNTVDRVTGVKNRYYFDTVFSQEWKRANRQGYPLSLLMLDIDHFKSVNDTYGHVTGDACLKNVAERIKSNLKRPADVLARFGGEEFVVLLPYVENQNAEHLAEQIRLSINNEKMKLEDQVIPITASLGVSTVYPGEDDEPKDLIAAADIALYEAKGNGRNQVSNAGMLKVHTRKPDKKLS